MPASAMNEDSRKYDSATSLRLYPIARSIPICWRRSTTVRNAITPSAAMPTISPSPMKPSNRYWNERDVDAWSSISLSIEFACTPSSSSVDSMSREVSIAASSVASAVTT